MIDSSDDTSAKEADYYAQKPTLGCVEAVVKLVDECKRQRNSLGFQDMAHANWNAYHNRDEGNASWGDGLYAVGDEGEKVRLRLGLLRQLVRHALTMITSIRPVIDPKATNTDSDSLRIVEITRALADHYLKGKKKLYKYIHRAVEHAVALMAGYVCVDWDPLSGDVYDTIDAASLPQGIPSLPSQAVATDETGQPIPLRDVFCGDVVFDTPTFFDVFWDQNAKSWDDIDWICIRRVKNRHEVIARYPLYEDEIKAAAKCNEPALPYDRVPAADESGLSEDNVEVFTYYHRKTLAVPQGRRLVYLDSKTPLEDDGLQFSRLPVIRIAPEEILGTSHGFSPVNLLRPIEEMLNKNASAIATNHAAFAIPQLLVDSNAGIDAPEITGGLGIIPVEGLVNSPNDPVRPLKLLGVPKEVFDFTTMLKGYAVGNMGLNEVVLGNPPPGLNAGVAINLFQSMAYQAASQLERSYAEAVEDAILLIVEAHRAHPDIERVIEIVGRSKRTSLGRFYGKDLHVIDRISVDMGNPMSRTVAGRQSLLQALRETGVEISAQQAVGVLNTGNLEQATEGLSDEILLIHDENELIAKAQFAQTPPPDPSMPFVQLPMPPEPGQMPLPPPPAPYLWGVPPVRAGDNHALHLQEHRTIGADMSLRNNPAVSMALDIHEGWHVKFHMNGDVILGIATGQIMMGAGAMPQPQIGPDGKPMQGPPGQAGAPQPHSPAQPPHSAPPAPRMRPPPPKGPSVADTLAPPRLPPVHMDSAS